MKSDYKRKLERGYNVALHGIRDSIGSREVAEKIVEEGLNIPITTSIRSTTIQLGDVYRNKNFEKELNAMLKSYKFGIASEGYTIIIKTPTLLKNSKGEELYLGDPYLGIKDEDMGKHSIKYNQICLLDCVCARIGKIPPEFIYGYINFEKGVIETNPNHYSKNNDNVNKVDALYDKVKSGMNNWELDISRAIVNGDSKMLEGIKNLSEQYGLSEVKDIIEKVEKQYGLNRVSDIDFD